MEDQVRFYEWLVKLGSIHTADNKKMARAYEVIDENNTKVRNLRSKN